MTPENYLLRKLMLPHLKLIYVEKISNKTLHYHCVKTTDWEVCRKCPTKSFNIHDHRIVSIRDTKFHTKNIRLIIRKRRFRCPNCKSVFTESINGIKVGFRTTEKYRNQILHNYKNFHTSNKIKGFRFGISIITMYQMRFDICIGLNHYGKHQIHFMKNINF